MTSSGAQRLRAVAALFLTLAVLQLVGQRPVALLVLLAAWAALFWPLNLNERVMFVLASAFFLLQDYVTLKAGLFEFRDKDMLLMPWYEPPLWGFYYLAMKRFISGHSRDDTRLDLRSVLALVVTSLMFSLFSANSHRLFLATSASTMLLLAMFHTPGDLAYALVALVLGFVVELFGVSTGMWSYPAPDFLGMPYWFATMWISVGLLGRRFLIPASDWIVGRLGAGPGQRE